MLSADELLDAARRSGLAAAQVEPVCMAVKREPAAGRTRQLYVAVFDAPAVRAFRQDVARLYADAGGTGTFDPMTLDPVLPIASSDANFLSWWPLDIDREADCVAPLN